jgi:hypothetical protein
VTAAGLVALISGASNPVTRPIAVSFGEQGMDVALSTTINGDAAVFAMQSIANELWALDRRHLAIPPGDASADPVEQTVDQLGRIDLLVTLPEGDAPRAAIDQAVLDYLRVRPGGVLLLCQAAAGAMPDRAGAILNCADRTDASSDPAAAAAETGVVAATQSLAQMLQPRVAVNAAVVGANTDPLQIAALAIELLGSQVSGQVFEL